MHFVFKLISFLDKLVPKRENQIVYTSFPDFSDNSFAIFIYIANNYPEFKNIWLIDHPEKINAYNKMTKDYLVNNDKKYKFVKKNSLKGVFYYLTSRYVLFTHGLYTGVDIPDNHIVVNLWHGMPLKRIAYLDQNFKGTVQKFTYMISTSPLYQNILARAFQVPKEKILITGQPRNDLLLNTDRSILKKFNIDPTLNKVFMWMPTYRKSIFGDIRTDGKENNGFPVLTLNDLKELNDTLKAMNSYLIIKLHPMDSLTLKEFKQYSHIQIIKNEIFEEKGVQLYSLLGAIDVLLTDYSSVYIDFLLTGKPLAFVMEDMEDFSKSRGFIFEKPFDYMPGDIIKNKIEFINFITNPQIASNYSKVNCEFNSIHHNSSELIIDHLRLLEH